MKAARILPDVEQLFGRSFVDGQVEIATELRVVDLVDQKGQRRAGVESMS
jgi:hypothetical protein